MTTNNFVSTITQSFIPYQLPENWRWFFWSDLMKSYQQGLIRSNNQLGSGNVKYLKMGDLDAKGFANLSNLAETNANEKEITSFLLKKGDFLINVRNTKELVGKTCIINNTNNFSILFNHMLVRIDHGDSDLNYYINAFLNIPSSKKLLDGIKQGTTTVIALYQRELNNVPIPVPDEKTFKTIVNLYKAIISKIELNNKINAELEQMAKTLYDYWFVQYDFPDHNGKPFKTSGGKMIWSDELKKKIPEGWEVKSLIDITNVSTESINPFNYPDREFKHYSIPTFDELGTYGVEKGNAIMSNKFTIAKTDVLVSKLNPWFNRVIYSTEENDLISSTEFVIWRSNNVDMKNYLYMIARDPSFVSYCVNSATGTSNSHKRVNPTVMMRYKIAHNKYISEYFGSKLGSAIKMYAKNQVENKTLLDLRDWLLPMLMNGQVKINN